MRHSALVTVFCVFTLALGGLSTLGAGAPTDSLWLKAVALSDKNDNLVPGMMKMHMQEVDKHGEIKDDEKFDEVWSVLSLGEDGEVEYEMIKTIENGKDITEEEKAKQEREKAREKNEEDEESDSHEMKGYSPFGLKSQARIEIEAMGDGGVVDGRNTVVYQFAEQTEDDVLISGKAWLEAGTGIPVKTEYTRDPLPKRVKRMVTTMEYEHIYPDSLIIRHMFMEVTGGILFIKKHFHMNVTFDEYWTRPDGDDKPDRGE